MTPPKFNVGETVILSSVTRPEENGVHVIDARVFAEDWTIDDGRQVPGWGYRMECAFGWFHESALRRRGEASGMDELIAIMSREPHEVTA